VKWRRDLAALDDPPREGASTYYTYLSPRLRRNRFGYFSSSQAVRAGAGRRFAPLDDLSLSLEFGPGLRLGRARSGENIREGVLTASSQLDYRVSDSTQLRLALMSERSSREHYQTAVATLRNRVSRHVWLKYELSYRKALPMDTLQPVGETRFDAGISCQF
jgi:putative salt-induced outer membrane protein